MNACLTCRALIDTIVSASRGYPDIGSGAVTNIVGSPAITRRSHGVRAGAKRVGTAMATVGPIALAAGKTDVARIAVAQAGTTVTVVAQTGTAVMAPAQTGTTVMGGTGMAMVVTTTGAKR